MEADEKKTVVHVKIEPSLRAKGHKKAKEYGLSLSAYLRALLKNGVEGDGALVIKATPSKRRSA